MEQCPNSCEKIAVVVVAVSGYCKGGVLGGFPRDELFSKFASNTRRKFRFSEVFRHDNLLGKCFFLHFHVEANFGASFA